ncbi:hypothetical protein [Halomonas denitrificans]|uniref:hypothetical protein n=1 Tax=Halomonas denitrificans TaxID=370769 RepID=UPI0013008C2D|nr:hypothetical protein [Halomonas denitrificans]
MTDSFLLSAAGRTWMEAIGTCQRENGHPDAQITSAPLVRLTFRLKAMEESKD